MAELGRMAEPGLFEAIEAAEIVQLAGLHENITRDVGMAGQQIQVRML